MKQGIKHTTKSDKSSYFLTLTVVGWIDVFTRQNHRDIVVDALRFCILNKGLNVYAYCLMSNHLHMIVNCNDPNKLSAVITDFKRHTTKPILEQIKKEPESRKEWMLKVFSEAATAKHKTYEFWQAGNHALQLYNEKFAWTKIRYIHNNPVVEGLVKRPQDWIYSSATNYREEESALDEVVRLVPALWRF